MAADGAGGSAGRIDQHKRHALISMIARIGLDDRPPQALVRPRFSRTRAARRRIHFDRGDFRRRAPPAAWSCRPARRKDRSLFCPRHRPAEAPAARRRRPAPTSRLRQNRAGLRRGLRPKDGGPDRTAARSPAAARQRISAQCPWGACFRAARARWRACSRLAILRHPARPQPVGRAKARRVQPAHHLFRPRGTRAAGPH